MKAMSLLSNMYSGKEHRKPSHSGEKCFTCDICYKTFSQSSHLKRHLFVHTGEKPYRCETCGRPFARRDHLQVHLRTHIEVEKPHRCDTCGKSFVSTERLETHMLIHAMQRCFECEYCDRSFTRRGDIERHVRTHAGEQPGVRKTMATGLKKSDSGRKVPKLHNTGEMHYRCVSCDKTFTQMEHLQQHFFTHEDEIEKPYRCDTCGKFFARTSGLKKHSLIHMRASQLGVKV